MKIPVRQQPWAVLGHEDPHRAPGRLESPRLLTDAGALGLLALLGSALVVLERVVMPMGLGSPGLLGTVLLIAAGLATPVTSLQSATSVRVGLGLLFVGASAVSLAQVDQSLGSWLSDVALYIQLLALYIVGIRLGTRDAMKSAVWGGVALGAVVMTAGVYWSWLTGYIAANYYFPGESTRFYELTEQRFTFPGVDPNYVALFIGIGAGSILWQAGGEGRLSWRIGRAPGLALSLAMFFAIVLTGSRGVALAFIAAILWVVVKSLRGKPRMAVIAGMLVAGALSITMSGALPTNPLADRQSDGLTSRIEVITETSDEFLTEPLFGIGRIDRSPDYDPATNRTRVHGAPFSLVLERGLVASALIVVVLIMDLRRARSIRVARSSLSSFVLSLLVVTSLSLNVEELRMTWLVVGVILGSEMKIGRRSGEGLT